MPTLVVEILDGIAIDGFLPDAMESDSSSYTAKLRGYAATEPLIWRAVGGAWPSLAWGIDEEDGTVTGPLGMPGEYHIRIRLQDAMGYTVTRDFRWRIHRAPERDLHLTEAWHVPPGDAADLHII